MDSILEKQIVLQLNGNWERIGWRTVRDSIVCLCEDSSGVPNALSLDIDIDEDGKATRIDAVPWSEWIKLPVRPCDLSISTGRGAIRAPVAIVASHFRKMPRKSPRLSPGTIFERDGGVCQYTGRKLARKQGNIDHIIPRARGGKDSWENLVWSDKDLNLAKGSRLNSEAGLKLIRQPKSPPSVPASFTIKDARHPLQQPFF